MYGVWTVCFIFCFLGLFSFGRLSALLTLFPDTAPVQFVAEAGGGSINRVHFVAAAIGYFLFSFLYIFALAIIFK